MRIARRVDDLALPWGDPIGFVPTMGAFHEGHLELMRTAKRECGFCVVSLFVNPTQFGPNEDFARYPRNEERDFELARSADVDVMFAPDVAEIYSESRTIVHIEGVSERWEGAHRPGHFDGVATVVAKLFNIIDPAHAYFGLKDYQQCAVISELVRDLKFRLQLRLLDTVREPDGLAMSSRNVYLSPEHRRIAPLLFQTLSDCAASILRGETASTCLESTRATLTSEGFDVHYCAMVRGVTLEPIDEPEIGARLIVAATLGSTRLIDNVSVF